MTLPVTSRRAGPLSCNGSLQDFDFDFKVFDEADIEVILTSSLDVETTLALTSNYTVTLNADQDANPGGTITTVSTYATGYSITIIGALTYGQTTELTNRGGFFPKVIERALDRIVMLIQQVKELTDRSLTLPASASSGVSTELPVPTALNLVGWDGTATGLTNYDSADLAASIVAASWTTETFSGDGVETTFTLAADPGSASNCDVTISGVSQVAGADFTLDGLDIIFTVAPVAGTDNIAIRYGTSLSSSEAAAAAVAAAASATAAATAAQSLIIAPTDETTAITTGTAKITFRMPYAFTLTAVRASLTSAQTSGSIFTVDINESGSSILSTKLTIDNNEKTSTTAATAAVISDSSLADDAEITIDVDQVGNGSATGLKVYLIGYKTA